MEDQLVAERAGSIWKKFTKVIVYWEGLCKSSRLGVKSYQTLVNHHRDLLILMKLFASLASNSEPYITVFQTNNPMVPFMQDNLEKILNQLLRLGVQRDALDKPDTPLKKLNSKRLEDRNQNSKLYFRFIPLNLQGDFRLLG